MLLAAALVGLALPSAASAQGGALLDGTPLNVFADGLGAIQVRQDGVASGLFYDPDQNPGHAGLEIKEGESYYPLEEGFTSAPGRVSIAIHYGLENVTGDSISIRAGALADLYVGNNDAGNGAQSNVAPRFVGGRDETSGLVYGL